MAVARTASAAALAIAAVLATTSCSGGNGIPDPCGLLTEEQIEAATGIGFDGGTFDEDLSTDTQSLCVWHSDDDPGTFVQVLVSEGAAQVQSQRAEAVEYLGTSQDETVAGARDAYSLESGAILGMAVDDYFVQVSAITRFAFTPAEVTGALAPEVAAALG